MTIKFHTATVCVVAHQMNANSLFIPQTLYIQSSVSACLRWLSVFQRLHISLKYVVKKCTRKLVAWLKLNYICWTKSTNKCYQSMVLQHCNSARERARSARRLSSFLPKDKWYPGPSANATFSSEVKTNSQAEPSSSYLNKQKMFHNLCWQNWNEPSVWESLKTVSGHFLSVLMRNCSYI